MAKRKKDKPPSPIVVIERGRLTPATATDAELIEMTGAKEFDLVPRSKRSPPHNGKYWVQLHLIVAATEAFSSATKMHNWIKVQLGYTEVIYGPNGEEIAIIPDSTAFEEMDQPAFNLFYEQAVRLVLEAMGIDMNKIHGGSHDQDAHYR